MKSAKIFQNTMTLAIVLCACQTVTADTIRQVDLPPQAELVVHVDLEECSANELSSQMVADLIDTEYVTEQLKSVPTDLAPLLDNLPSGITWVLNVDQQAGLAVFSDADHPTLINAIRQAPSYVDFEYRGMGVHHWKSDLENLASHFNQADASTNKAEQEENIVSFYVAVAGDGHVALSNDLRMLVEWIERVTGNDNPMSSAEFDSRFDSRQLHPLITVDQRPSDEASTSDGELPIRSVNAVIWADTTIHARAIVDLGSESMATVVTNLGQPETLANYIVEMTNQAREQTIAAKDDDQVGTSSVDDARDDLSQEVDGTREDDDGPKNSIGFGVGFRGLNLKNGGEPNKAEIQQFLSETTLVSCDGSTITIQWSGHARLEYEHQFQDGRNNHAFHAWLGERSEDAARLAERPVDREERR